MEKAGGDNKGTDQRNNAGKITDHGNCDRNEKQDSDLTTDL